MGRGKASRGAGQKSRNSYHQQLPPSTRGSKTIATYTRCYSCLRIPINDPLYRRPIDYFEQHQPRLSQIAIYEQRTVLILLTYVQQSKKLQSLVFVIKQSSFAFTLLSILSYHHITIMSHQPPFLLHISSTSLKGSLHPFHPADEWRALPRPAILPKLDDATRLRDLRRA